MNGRMQTKLPIVTAACPELPEAQLELLAQFKEALLEWNTKINLISRKDTEHFETHHLLSSLAIVKGVNFPDGATLLDIGTGGGLPGIPLAICYPNCRFHLVDSIGRSGHGASNVAGFDSRGSCYKENLIKILARS